MPILIRATFPPFLRSQNYLPSLFVRKTILLVSRDERLQDTWALVLRQGSYHTMSTKQHDWRLQPTGRCQLAIIGHSFTPNEQDDSSTASMKGITVSF
jgi:hypothetical protein